MNIYKSILAPAYVYICREKHSSKFYIGYRYRNWLPAMQDFGTHYFTSNEYVKANFQNFDYEILAEFTNPKDALAFESKIIKEMRTEDMINLNPTSPRKPYQIGKAVDSSEKLCALPECENTFSNWRSICCCPAHSKRYAGLKRHNKI